MCDINLTPKGRIFTEKIGKITVRGVVLNLTVECARSVILT